MVRRWIGSGPTCHWKLTEQTDALPNGGNGTLRRLRILRSKESMQPSQILQG